MSRPVPMFSAEVVAGKIKMADNHRFKEYLATLPERVNVIVKPYRKVRSNPQNRYLWGCVYPLIANTTGYSTEEVHDIMRTMFLRHWTELNGVEIEVVRSTTSLSTKEMSEYWEKIQQWASRELSVVIPDPQEVYP